MSDNNRGWTKGPDSHELYVEAMEAKAQSELAAPTGSAENVCLSNDTKIRFCNAFDAIKAHCILCKECDVYMRWGDGDLCSAGKTIIAMELCFTDTGIEFQPNEKGQP